jgi:hypothetical protein
VRVPDAGQHPQHLMRRLANFFPKHTQHKIGPGIHLAGQSYAQTLLLFRNVGSAHRARFKLATNDLNSAYTATATYTPNRNDPNSLPRQAKEKRFRI